MLLQSLGPRADFSVQSATLSKVRDSDQHDPSRAIGLSSVFFPGYGGAVGIEQINGPDPLIKKEYSEYLRAAGFQLIWGWRIFLNEEDLAKLAKQLDFLNVGWIIRKSEVAVDEAESHREPIRVERRPSKWPRAFAVENIEQIEDIRNLVNTVRERTTPFASVTGEVAKSLQLKDEHFAASTGIVEVKRINLLSSKLELDVEVKNPSLLVINQAYFKGMKAYVNGTATPVFPVNFVHSGIRLGLGGAFHVVVAYEPDYWVIQKKLWLFVPVLYLVLVLCMLRLKSKTAKPLPGAL